jgi:hypothetical protein
MEAIMDIYSLFAAHLHGRSLKAPMSARAEDRYYASQFTVPALSPTMLRSVGLTVGVMLIAGLVALI